MTPEQAMDLFKRATNAGEMVNVNVAKLVLRHIESLKKHGAE